MTISEQLQFSVLTAPVAALDRRTLSQAWYSALYGSAHSKAAVAHKPCGPQRSDAPAPLPHAPPAATSAAPASGPRTRVHAGRSPLHVLGSAYDRRAMRSPLARKIERAFLRPRTASAKNSFTLASEHGRVHVLLRSCGKQLKLVAICPPKARVQVAAALAQARYALALRGIDLDAQAQEGAAC